MIAWPAAQNDLDTPHHWHPRAWPTAKRTTPPPPPTGNPSGGGGTRRATSRRPAR
jgi:hypothetical protein